MGVRGRTISGSKHPYNPNTTRNLYHIIPTYSPTHPHTQQATKEDDQSIVNASFHVTHWSVAPFGTGLSRLKFVGRWSVV